MAMSKEEIQKWLNQLPDNSTVAIDDGGLSLVEVLTLTEIAQGDRGAWLEVGGIPEPEEEDMEVCEHSREMQRDNLPCEICEGSGYKRRKL